MVLMGGCQTRLACGYHKVWATGSALERKRMKDASQNDIARDRDRLQNPYAHLQPNGEFAAVTEVVLAPTETEQHIAVDDLIGSSRHRRMNQKGRRYSDQDIELIARRFLTALWKRNHQVSEIQDGGSVFTIIDPRKAANALGYHFVVNPDLGRYRQAGNRVEIAGQIDQQAKSILISDRQPLEAQRFTAAHELGHAVLHPGVGLHRDRPVSKGGDRTKRPPMEAEADRFAVGFLMPEKLVRQAFRSRFGVDKLQSSDDFRFELRLALGGLPDTRRALARGVASATTFAGNSFTSMSEMFGVSVEAMAIRLEELGCA